MAGISATLSREDLKFMAEDIGSELVPFLKPEDVLKGMDPEKQRKLIASMVEDMGPELVPFLKTKDLQKGMDPEKQRELISLLSPKEILAKFFARFGVVLLAMLCARSRKTPLIPVFGRLGNVKGRQESGQ